MRWVWVIPFLFGEVIRCVRRMGWGIPLASIALYRFSRCCLWLGQHKIMCCWSAWVIPSQSQKGWLIRSEVVLCRWDGVWLCRKCSLIMVTISSLDPSISPNQGLPWSNGWTSEYCLPLVVWLSFHCRFLLLVICCLDCIFRSDIVVVVISFPVVMACFAYLSAIVLPSHPEWPFTQIRDWFNFWV